MFNFLMILHVFVSIVLILVILLQAGRGSGLSEMFGGSSTKTIFGTSTAKFLTRATAACAALFILTSLSLAVLSSRRSKSLMGSRAAQRPIKAEEAVPALPGETGSQELDIPVEDDAEPVSSE